MRRGELAKAQDLVDGALKSTQPATPSVPEWQLRLLAAEISLDRLEPSRAQPHLTAPVPVGASFDNLRARQKYLQSRVEVIEGKLPEAQQSLEQVRKTALADEGLRLDAQILSGQIHLRLSRWQEGEQELEAVVRRTQTIGDRYRQAVALNTLGMGRLIRTRYDEAVTWFERVLTLNDLNEMTIYAVALYNAGICYSRLGQFERAKAVQQRAVQVHARRGPSRQLVESLGSLGTTYGLNGEAQEAIPFLERALDTATKTNLTADAALWAGNLATAHASLGHWNEAKRLNDEATALGARTQREAVYLSR